MAEGGTRPIAAKLYQSPADSGQSAGSTYKPPGTPAPREPEATLGVRRNNPEIAADSHRTEPTPTGPRPAATVPPVGARVVHRTSGQHGQVVGHQAHGYSGTAVPQVTWAGEDASWPQGVSANALRVEGSHPNDLYQYNEDATSTRPLNRNTGAL
jgi:hypothetical protein